MVDARCIWPAGALLGEGPVWRADEATLYWVDIKAPAVHAFEPSTGVKRTYPMPEEIGCIAPRRGGGWVAGLRSGFAFLDLDTGRIDRVGGPEADIEPNRINDGKCDARGRFWAGTMDDNERAPSGALYRMDTDATIVRIDDGYIVTNGPAFSPDGKTLYHTDTFLRTIYAFDLAPDGAVDNKRTFITIPDSEGYPDGMTVDSAGGLWVAHWGGRRVSRFLPDGSRDRVLELPVAQVTSCAFGGPDLSTLFITTASIRLDDAARRAQPLAGGLFEASTDFSGLPAGEFAG